MHLVVAVVLAFVCSRASGHDLQITPDLSISWIIVNNYTITMWVTLGSPRGWVGLGWHKLGDGESGDGQAMSDCDFVVGQTVAPTGVWDMYSDMSGGTGGFQSPINDTQLPGGKYSLLSTAVMLSDVSASFGFERLLDTGDPADHAFAAGQVLVVWAYSQDGSGLGYHGMSNRGYLTVDFVTGESFFVVPSNLPYWHGSLMTVSFAICMTWGIFVSRFLKHYTWWFPLHITLQLAGVFGAIAAFVIALLMTKGGHFKSVHSVFGLVTFIIAMISPVLGVLAHFMWNPQRLGAVPIFPDMIHWWSGRLTVVLSYVTISLGLRLFEAPVPIQIVALALFIGYLLLAVGIELYTLVQVRSARSDYEPSDAAKTRPTTVHTQLLS